MYKCNTDREVELQYFRGVQLSENNVLYIAHHNRKFGPSSAKVHVLIWREIRPFEPHEGESSSYFRPFRSMHLLLSLQNVLQRFVSAWVAVIHSLDFLKEEQKHNNYHHIYFFICL